MGILTEEELKEIIGLVEYDIEEGHHTPWFQAKILLEEIARLNGRNRNLVLENDEQTAEIEEMKWICKRSYDFIAAMKGFTGQNLLVLNWHQNGDGEPFDNFVEENLEENLVKDLKTVLEGLE